MCISLGLKNFELSLETAENYVSLKFSMFTKANYPSKCVHVRLFDRYVGRMSRELSDTLA